MSGFSNLPLPCRARQYLRTNAVYAKFHLHTWLGKYPDILFPLYSLLGIYQDRIVTPETELVIEGFPRSATTWCCAAFQVAQGRPVRLASHIHLPAQVIRAVRTGIPALVLVRHPRDAVASAVIREPYASVRAHLQRYLVFYRSLEPYRHGFVVADFDQVTTDLAAVIRRLNSRYGTNFMPFDGGPSDIEAVNRLLDQRHERFGGGAMTSYRPNPLKEMKKLSVDFSGKEDLLARCERLYAAWLEPDERRG